MISLLLAATSNANDLDRSLVSITRELNDDLEVIVVHPGGHAPTETEISRRRWVKPIIAEGTRSAMLNAGAAAASGDLLLFVTPGTTLQRGWFSAVKETAEKENFSVGSLKLKIEGKGGLAPVAERLLRSKTHPRIWQGLFLTKADFDSAGGFPEQADFEDLSLLQKFGETDKAVTFANSYAFLPRSPFDREGMMSRARRLSGQRNQFLQGAEVADIDAGNTLSDGRDGVVLLLPNPATNSVIKSLSGPLGRDQCQRIIAALVRGSVGMVDRLPSSTSLSFGVADESWMKDLGYISTVGAPVYAATDGSLGSILKQAYDAGLGRLTVIDPLQPGLSVSDLRRSFAVQDEVDVALGATEGEGAYALGVDKAKAAAFDDFQLRLPLSIEGLRAFAEGRSLSVTDLPVRRKLEDLEDYVHFYNSGMVEV